MASHVVPLLLAFFLGSYSDKRGRKIILLAGLLGKLFFSVMITINTAKGKHLVLKCLLMLLTHTRGLSVNAGCRVNVGCLWDIFPRALILYLK